MEINKDKLVYTWGINDANYVTQKFEKLQSDSGLRKHRLMWICPFYRAWKAMVQRCYSKSFLKNNPAYGGCSVCEEWKYFSNFKAWMETQDWEGKHLDKDLLVANNKVYSQETCIFISKTVNSFMTERHNDRGVYPIGVYWSKDKQKFVAQCNNPFTGDRGYLGTFDTPEEAHKAWLKRKLELAKLLAAEQEDSRIAEALISKYGSYITK